LSWFVMGVVLLVLWRTIAWLSRLSKRRTWSVAAPALRRRPRRHRRLGDATRRRVAVKRARELVAALAQGWQEKSLYSAVKRSFRYGPRGPHG
jgi:hypothetical protein